MTIQRSCPTVPAGAALQQLLQNTLVETGVPGASFAVRRGSKVQVAVAGTIDLRTGVCVTPDTKFQAGSITKPLVATLAMMLVDRGVLDLDWPIAAYLPHLRAYQVGKKPITPRHLLNHSSGIDGDFLPEGNEHDADPAQYVESLVAAKTLHPAGEGFSYCNAGYVVLANLIETLSGLTWDDALNQWLAEPLDMKSIAIFPNSASAADLASGHVTGADGPVPQEVPYAVPTTFAPAGSALALTAVDLIKFATLHLAEGRTPVGERILSQRSARAMCKLEIPLPQPAFASAIGWGLGWCLYRHGDRTILGHDGDTVGHFSFLRLDPINGDAVALLTNGGDARALADRLFDRLLPSGKSEVPYPSMDTLLTSFEPQNYTGRYIRAGRCLDIGVEDDRLVACLSFDPTEGPFEPKHFRLEPVAPHLFLAEPPESSPAHYRFGAFNADGRAGNVFSGYRLLIRETQ